MKMEKYPKINSIFKRYREGPKIGQFIYGHYSKPVFKLLRDKLWQADEKIDGTGMQIRWQPSFPVGDYRRFRILGRSSTAQIPAHLLEYMQSLNLQSKFERLYSEKAMCLYGEGYGAGVQQGGGKYIPEGVGFILFDIKIDQYWLKRESILDIAHKLDINVVPKIGTFTLQWAIYMCRKGFKSTFGDFIAEGLVLRPVVDLVMQSGERVITKIKYVDFKKERKRRLNA
jgi:hypothetical protein